MNTEHLIAVVEHVDGVDKSLLKRTSAIVPEAIYVVTHVLHRILSDITFVYVEKGGEYPPKD